MLVPKPLLKWVGGKTQILDRIVGAFPRVMDNYYEPFVGGGSVLLALLAHRQAGNIRVRGRLYACDLNATLIGFYRNVQSRHEELFAEVQVLVAEYAGAGAAAAEGTGAETPPNRAPANATEAQQSKEAYYYWVRALFNALPDKTTPQASAMFLFLNKTGFRGIYREGPRGFNVPFGHYKSPEVINRAHLNILHDMIQDVQFHCRDFAETLVEVVGADDFAYLDPPYAPETATSFVGYTEQGFAADRHAQLFGLLHDMTRSGKKWMMSNADVPLVREHFAAGETVSTVSCRRKINSKAPDATTNEVVITNYPSPVLSQP